MYALFLVWFHFHRVDVTEIQIAGIVIFMISGIFGVQVWSLQVRHVFHDIPCNMS